jgi:hypothetical protein
VTVNQVIVNPLLASEVFKLPAKIDEVGVEGPLVNMAIRPGSKMNQADLLREPDNAVASRVLKASEDIHLVAPSSKFSGQFPDVDTHSPGILGAQFAQGTRVDAEHGNLEFFSLQLLYLVTSGEPRSATPSSTKCDAAPIETNRRSPQTVLVGFPAFQKIVDSSTPLDAIPDAEYLAQQTHTESPKLIVISIVIEINT